MKLKIYGFKEGEGYTELLEEVEVEPTTETSWLRVEAEIEETTMIEGKAKSAGKVKTVFPYRVYLYEEGPQVMVRTYRNSEALPKNEVGRQVTIWMEEDNRSVKVDPVPQFM